MIVFLLILLCGALCIQTLGNTMMSPSLTLILFFLLENGETISVPLDPNNRHYAEIIKQVEGGDLTIADAE